MRRNFLSRVARRNFRLDGVISVSTSRHSVATADCAAQAYRQTHCPQTKSPRKPRAFVRLCHEKFLERAKGFEPSTPTLARSCSTTELHPHPRDGGDSSPAAGRAMPNAAHECNSRVSHPVFEPRIGRNAAQTRQVGKKCRKCGTLAAIPVPADCKSGARPPFRGPGRARIRAILT
jgi:hypothetical protein